LGIDVKAELKDFGDVTPINPTTTAIFESIDPIFFQIFKSNMSPMVLGGDHSVTYSIMKSIRRYLNEPCVIVHFDAHPDIYDNFMDNVDSHASPFARIMEHQGELCRKLISIGIRTATSHQREQIAKYNVETIEAKDFPSKGRLIYVNVYVNIYELISYYRI
jgi:arginase family enzyme